MAKLSCGFKCAKYFLFVFNFIFWAAGAVLLAIGIWFLVDSDALKWLHVSNIADDESLIKAAAIIIVVVGGLMFVVGGLGCCAAWREVSGCLLTFAAILIILLLGQLVTGILAGIFYDKITANVEQRMNVTLQTKYGLSNASMITEAWDLLQREMSCCGLRRYTDWFTSWWHNNNNRQTQPSWPVPATCCTMDPSSSRPINETFCSADATFTYYNTTLLHAPYLNVQGCETSFKMWVRRHLAIIIGVAIGLIMVQLIGIIVACCLGMQIRNVGTIA